MEQFARKLRRELRGRRDDCECERIEFAESAIRVCVRYRDVQLTQEFSEAEVTDPTRVVEELAERLRDRWFVKRFTEVLDKQLDEYELEVSRGEEGLLLSMGIDGNTATATCRELCFEDEHVRYLFHRMWAAISDQDVPTSDPPEDDNWVEVQKERMPAKHRGSWSLAQIRERLFGAP